MRSKNKNKSKNKKETNMNGFKKFEKQKPPNSLRKVTQMTPVNLPKARDRKRNRSKNKECGNRNKSNRIETRGYNFSATTIPDNLSLRDRKRPLNGLSELLRIPKISRT